MIYKDENWCFNDYIKNGQPFNPRPFPIVVEDDVFISCNISRWKAYKKTFNNVKDLTFINCNLNGIDIKNTWVLDDNCSFVQNDYIEETEDELQGPI